MAEMGQFKMAADTITAVKEAEWSQHGFNKFTALRIKNAPSAEGDPAVPSTITYDFFVNVDNQWLKSEQKRSKQQSPKILEARFMYSLVLVGLALLQEDRTRPRPETSEEDADAPTDESNGENVEKRVDRFTAALAPILLPMLELIPDLEDETSPA